MSATQEKAAPHQSCAVCGTHWEAREILPCPVCLPRPSIDSTLRQAVSERLGPEAESKIYADALRTQEKAAPPQTHTPGPWESRNCAVYGPITPTGREAALAICQCVAPQKVNMDVARANARLVAAAPELLEALENTTQTLRLMLAAVAIDDYPAEARQEVRKEIKLAEAAIAKARGRQL